VASTDATARLARVLYAVAFGRMVGPPQNRTPPLPMRSIIEASSSGESIDFGMR
jgi:hypothetical protein